MLDEQAKIILLYILILNILGPILLTFRKFDMTSKIMTMCQKQNVISPRHLKVMTESFLESLNSWHKLMTVSAVGRSMVQYDK